MSSTTLILGKPLGDIRKWMFRQLDHFRKDYLDCGEVNATVLAENAAHEFDLYEENADATIPEEVFDMAVEISEQFEDDNEEEDDE